MKQGGGQARQGSTGFTIVETLIVLTVSATLAASALLLIGGKQQKTAFVVAVGNTKQQIQQILNQTASGYFPGVQCNTTSPGNPKITGVSATQGTSDGCIFIGNTVLMAVKDHPGQFITYPLAGRLYKYNTTAPATTLADAFPTPFANGDSKNPGTNLASLAAKTTIEDGLITNKMWYCTGDVCDASHRLGAGAFAYISDLGATNGGADITSGSQGFSLYAVDAPAQTGDLATPLVTSAVIDNLGDAANYKHASEVDFCISDGGNQSGLITIGGSASNGQVSVTSYQYSNGDCI